jgi:hypothetical protein
MQREAADSYMAPPRSSAVDIRVVDDSGGAYELFGPGRQAMMVGRRGARYSIVVKNRSTDRVEAVASVDGLDVLDGRPASLAKRGYIVAGGSTLRIEGFRQSDSTVAAFRFGEVGDSYAASKGDTRDVGVIGVAVFGDRDAPDRNDAQRRLEARPFGNDPDPRYAAPPTW